MRYVEWRCRAGHKVEVRRVLPARNGITAAWAWCPHCQYMTNVERVVKRKARK